MNGKHVTKAIPDRVYTQEVLRLHAGSRNVRLASQISVDSHPEAAQRHLPACVRSSRVCKNDDAARPDLAIFCCEKAQELLASITKEILRLQGLLGLSNIL